MNARENYLALLNHEKLDYIPNVFAEICLCGGEAETFENGPAGGGEDGFGCRWHATKSANGQPVPEPNYIVLKDVTAWKDIVKFPDLDKFDWKAMAENQTAGCNRNEQVMEYHSWNSQFLRLTHLMGFENGLCALYEDPEACFDLMNAITDHKIRVIERVHKYFKPDVFVNYDDVATERSLFISRKTYQELIKPQHKRMNDAAKAYGMIPVQHCCGYCQDVIEDFIEEGAAAWQAAQPSNDIEWIIKTYGGKISVIGGYDTQGLPGQPAATTEQIAAEIKRCMNTYGKYGRSYGFFGFLLEASDDQETYMKSEFLMAEATRQGYAAVTK